MLVLALPGGASLAQALARLLRCEWSELQLHRFPDGEVVVRIDAQVQGRCVVLAGSLDRPEAKTMPLLFAADAAKELGASQVGLVAPYLSYMRQDARFRPGEAITSRTYARVLSSSLDFLVTADPHLHRWQSLSDIYSIPTQVVAAAPAIAHWLRIHVAQPLLVGPDEESAQWVSQVASLTDAPWTVLTKVRHGDHDVRVTLTQRQAWPGRTPILLDDIISTGNTLAAAARALKEAGLAAPMCIGVHALFEDDAMSRLVDAGFTRVITCDSVVHTSNQIRLAPLLARAVSSLVKPPAA